MQTEATENVERPLPRSARVVEIDMLAETVAITIKIVSVDGNVTIDRDHQIVSFLDQGVVVIIYFEQIKEMLRAKLF